MPERDGSLRSSVPSCRSEWRVGNVLVVHLLCACIGWGEVVAEVPDPREVSQRPNAVLVLADDLGWGDVGFNGSKTVKTPHLDAMAAASLRFRRFYSAAPVCSPTRASALTGRHPFRCGIYTANSGHLPEEEVTLAELLQEKGWRTGHFGKWHLGTLTTRLKDANRGGPGRTEHYAIPSAHGFDEWFSTESKVPTWSPMQRPESFRAEESLRYGWLPRSAGQATRSYGTRYWDGPEQSVESGLDGGNARLITDRALAFIRGAVAEERPFLAVVWYHTPHLPLVVGERYRRLYAERSLREQLYYGAISALDEQIGRLRFELRRLGVAPRTLIWFASDNGPEVRTPGSAGLFRGRKRSLWEGGVRVPCLLEWPDAIAAGRVTDEPAVTSDWLPTIADCFGVDLAALPTPRDGVSLRRLLNGESWTRPAPIAFWSRSTATLSGARYKLVVHGQGRGPERGREVRVELYDLIEDAGETTDLSSRLPEVVERSRGLLERWQTSCEQSAEGADYR